MVKKILISFCFCAVALVATAQNEPYKNPDLTPSERAWDLLKRMTLEEKISQMKNGSPAIERLGIPAYNWWNEALHGVARAGKATVFPQAIGLAATFDNQAVHETFSIVSDEARAKYHDFQRKGERDGYKGLTFWTPNINIYRDPRWGRGMETYGEDPYLTSLMGLAVVKGLQATFWNNKELEGEAVAAGHFSEPLNFGNGGNTVFMPGVNLHDFSARFESVYTSKESGEVSFIISADDGFRLFIDGEEVYSEWHNGATRENMYNLNAVKGKAYKVVLEYFQAGGEASLKFDIGIKKEINYKEVADKAAEADVIIFVGGLSSSLEGEEMPVDLPGFRKGDRTNIDLPQVQEEMLKALKKTGKPVVFVLCSGSTLALPWEAENLDAIIEAWYPGQQGGTAVADVLFGDYNPAGRLPLTFYASSSDLPDFEDYDMSNRTYRYFKGKPLFPFGHGLSYTTFDYGKAKADKKILRAGEGLTLTIPLKNIGKLSGDEVVQVYLRNPGDKDGPIKTLRAFRRISLEAGQAEDVLFELPVSTFEWFNPATNCMEVLSGKYELLYGGTSDEKALQRLTVTLKK